MRKVLILMALSTLCLTGCSRKENQSAKPVDKPEIAIGDSYETVLQKLGKPNVESSTDISRVMIYTKIEVKLENGAVVSVYDHR